MLIEKFSSSGHERKLTFWFDVCLGRPMLNHVSQLNTCSKELYALPYAFV